MRTSKPMGLVAALCGIAASGFFACSGSIDGAVAPMERGAPGSPGARGSVGGAGSATDKPGNPGGGSTGPAVLVDQTAAIGALPLRRLTGAQYYNTLRDLLGETVVMTVGVPPGSVDYGDGGQSNTSSALQYHETATKAAVIAVTDLPRLLGCDPQGAAEGACISQFVMTMGRRAYRRPLLPAEQSAYLALYNDTRKTLGYELREAVRVMLNAMLESPFFLYRWELGPTAPRIENKTQGAVRLTSHEVASRLSYFLWNSMPDTALFQAADANRLASREDLLAQVGRMLADPRSRMMVENFYLSALGTDQLAAVTKSVTKFPEFSPALLMSMENETRAFIRHVVFEKKEGTATLLSAPYSFVDSAMGKLYSLENTLTKVPTLQQLDPVQRAGLLTQAAFLSRFSTTSDSHPVKRGEAVYERILCGSVPPPPANVPAPKAPAPGLSTRERFSEHDRNECARACHELFDPIGFAFETYDAIGKYRTTDGGKPVDATGEVLFPWSKTRHKFADAVELTGQIAKSDDAERCLTQRWLVAALGRGVETKEVDQMVRPGKPRSTFELLSEIGGTGNFTTRTLSAGEVSQ